MEMKCTTREEAFLDKLVVEATMNGREAMRSSVQAAMLLKLTVEQLKKCKMGGFIHCCWIAINGNQGDLMDANVYDLERMHKLACVHLLRMLDQNLLEARTMSIIMDMLDERNFENEELRCVVWCIAVKCDARLNKRKGKLI